jgi:hypothetical protein
MIGVEDGLMQKIRQNMSHVIGVHCVAHQLHLRALIKNVLIDLIQF